MSASHHMAAGKVSPLPLPQAASVLNYRAISPLPSQNLLRLKHLTCSLLLSFEGIIVFAVTKTKGVGATRDP